MKSFMISISFHVKWNLFFLFIHTIFKIMLLVDRIINKEMRCKDVRKYKTLRNIYNKKQNTLNYVLFLIIICNMNMRHSMCKDERNFHISKTKFASCEEFWLKYHCDRSYFLLYNNYVCSIKTKQLWFQWLFSSFQKKYQIIKSYSGWDQEILSKTISVSTIVTSTL